MMHSTVTVLSPQRRLCVPSEDPVTQCVYAVKSRPKRNGLVLTFGFKFGSMLLPVLETFAFMSAEENLLNV